MPTEEYRAVRNQAQRLSTDEQFRLLEDLVAMLKKKSRPQHSILEFKGVGKGVWEGVDVDEYIRQERDSWEPKNDELTSHSISQNLSQPTSDSLQEEEQVELQIRNIAEKISQGLKLLETGERDSQARKSLTEAMSQALNSLRSAENAYLQSRGLEEKIK